ncbi:elongation factor G-binding protein [Halobacillus litoralis]|uniref:Elongation factor G-binding protein n=1 Tax=Halobacillus litoralis TaxID=45668 RepID=A0A845FEK4_9BACI|nr:MULTISPECIES: FusB/FusC family EF-G-binding protein [Halobacillus]MEC3885409.1 FusB/FusC family EF-G-binding protein [Halobacillus sp. HZG1]MYL72400.1 elongation factor G-binding protein [Halobacillus litoralis]
MERFIRSDQYHFIKNQAHNLLNSHMTTNDASVTQALQSITQEKVLDLFTELSSEQEQMIAQASDVKDETDAILYFSRLKQYVVPFPKLSEADIQKLFPKVKKLRVPAIPNEEWTELSYIGWNDVSANRKYIITTVDGELTGLYGHYKPLRQKSICSLCHEHEKVGMFTATFKGENKEETISRGNYICHNSQKCNQNIQSRQPLESFIKRMQA